MMRILWLLLALSFSAPASAHEWMRADGQRVNAEWIMENHPSCCGPMDCEPVPGRVILESHGWRVVGLKGSIHPRKVKRAPGRNPWACRDLSNDKLRCLFLPMPGGV